MDRRIDGMEWKEIEIEQFYKDILFSSDKETSVYGVFYGIRIQEETV